MRGVGGRGFQGELYVEQASFHVWPLTNIETLLPPKQIQKQIGGVLPGGLSLRGLSGGERKRVSVAVGILAAPSIIFLDEPTSGLDSCSALSVVEHLRDRARDSGLTIVASIHQPRAAVWQAFDTCSVLSGGLLLYAGSCSGAVPWFESIGMGPWRSDVHGTACDWVMDLVNIGFEPRNEEGGGKTISSKSELESAAARFASHYSNSASRPELKLGAVSQRNVHAFASNRSPSAASDEDTQTGGSDNAKNRVSLDDLAKRVESAAARDPEIASASSGEMSYGNGSSQAAEKRRRPSSWTVFRCVGGGSVGRGGRGGNACCTSRLPALCFASAGECAPLLIAHYPHHSLYAGPCSGARCWLPSATPPTWRAA